MWLLRENTKLNHYMSLFSSFNLCVQKLLYLGRFVSWLSLTLTLKGLLLDDQEVLNDQFLSITALGHLIWLWKELKKLPCRKGRCGHLNKQTFEKIWAIHQKKTVEKLVWGHEVRKALWRGLKASVWSKGLFLLFLQIHGSVEFKTLFRSQPTTTLQSVGQGSESQASVINQPSLTQWNCWWLYSKSLYIK